MELYINPVIAHAVETSRGVGSAPTEVTPHLILTSTLEEMDDILRVMVDAGDTQSKAGNAAITLLAKLCSACQNAKNPNAPLSPELKELTQTTERQLRNLSFQASNPFVAQSIMAAFDQLTQYVPG